LVTGGCAATAVVLVLGLAMHPISRAPRNLVPITTATFATQATPSPSTLHVWIDFGGVRVVLDQLANGKRLARAEKVPSFPPERLDTRTDPP
jgi:hypothetical protein